MQCRTVHVYVKYIVMEHRISSTNLARNLGDVLARVRYRGESFVVERNGKRVARVCPVEGSDAPSVGMVLSAWREAGKPDLAFASDLETVGRVDTVPTNPWGS